MRSLSPTSLEVRHSFPIEDIGLFNRNGSHPFVHPLDQPQRELTQRSFVQQLMPGKAKNPSGKPTSATQTRRGGSRS